MRAALVANCFLGGLASSGLAGGLLGTSHAFDDRLILLRAKNELKMGLSAITVLFIFCRHNVSRTLIGLETDDLIGQLPPLRRSDTVN